MADVVKQIIRAEKRSERLKIAVEAFIDYVGEEEGRVFIREASVDYIQASNRNLIAMPPHFLHSKLNDNEFFKPISEALNEDFGLQSKFRHYCHGVLSGLVLNTVNRIIVEDDLNNFYAELSD